MPRPDWRAQRRPGQRIFTRLWTGARGDGRMAVWASLACSAMLDFFVWRLADRPVWDLRDMGRQPCEDSGSWTRGPLSGVMPVTVAAAAERYDVDNAIRCIVLIQTRRA